MTVIAGLIALLAGCLLGWYGRFFVIEPGHMHALCAAAAPPAWCAVRGWLIEVTFLGTYGVLAVGGAAACWLLRGRPAAFFAVLALGAGGLGLYLYDTAWAASGILAALIRLPRVGRAAQETQQSAA
jgi:hypothetical protein